MRKIPTLFLRDRSGAGALITREVHPDCRWVIDGEGIATQKYDGTCVLLDAERRWWARREVRPGRNAPAGYVPVHTDPVTDKTQGWEPIEQSAFARWHAEALVETRTVVSQNGWPRGTYELVGPKINGNPERVDCHQLWAHAAAVVLGDVPRSYDGLAAYLEPHALDIEGIVWHHPDGRMAKIKKKDFRYQRRYRRI